MSVNTRTIYHGEKLVATIYGALNDVMYVPPHMDWRAFAWPQQDGRDRYARVLTVEHTSSPSTEEA